MGIKLAPKQVVALRARVKDLVELVRAREQAIMNICVVQTGIHRKTLIELFDERETGKALYRALRSAAGENAELIEQHSAEIKEHLAKLDLLEQLVGIPIPPGIECQHILVEHTLEKTDHGIPVLHDQPVL